MKASLNWLKTLVDINTDIEDLADSLSIAGFEVESIEDPSKGIRGVVIGYIDEIEKHPNADKLQICSVDIGLEKKEQIVCGATNAKKGVHVLVAKVGTYLPYSDITIKKSKLRGIESSGMICSYEELGIPSSSEGIAILEESNSKIPKNGEPASNYLGLDDVILDLAITANRPDGMSMIGIAREISALKGVNFNYEHFDEISSYELLKNLKQSECVINNEGLYSLHFIENLSNKIDSPEWLKDRLVKSGINSINSIVDITNYVMLETGQPLHAFDADQLVKITGKNINQDDFAIRPARNDEKFIALDKKEYVLTSKVQLITCNDIPIAIAGITGGLNSSVTSKTTKIWLEAAVFTPPSIREASREIGLRTESSSRFEKGISSHLTLSSAKRAIDLYASIHNSVLSKCFVSNFIDKQPNVIILRRNRINKILGKVNEVKEDSLNLNEKLNNLSRYIYDTEIEEILSSLGCILNKQEIGWEVKIPYYRSIDLIREIDLIEEIARLVGYDRFESKLPNPIKPGILNPNQITERRLRNSFVSLGLQEVSTYSLVANDPKQEKQIAISNPLLKETSHLRTNIWHEHIEISKRNLAAGKSYCWLFEIGKIYSSEETNLKEEAILSGFIVGNKSNEKWSDISKKSSLTYFEARGILESALKSIKVSTEDRIQKDHKFLHPGKSSEIYIEGNKVGYFGQIHPHLALENAINKDAFIFEIKLTNLLLAATRENKWITNYKSYPTVPAMERDLSLWVPKHCNTTDIVKSIKKGGKSILENIDLIDKYDDVNNSSARKSLTFRLRYRRMETTLTEKDINPIHDKIRSLVQKNHDAELRS